MTEIETAGDGWVELTGSSCSLPTAQKPLREAEFDALFAAWVRGVQRESPTSARFTLRRDEAVAGRLAELTAREAQCCSFFAFTLTIATDRLELRVDVPDAHADVLDALVERARTLAG